MEHFVVLTSIEPITIAMRYIRWKYGKDVLARVVQEELHDVIMKVEKRRSL